MKLPGTSLALEITEGPRYRALTTALSRARLALSTPLSSREIGLGWNEYRRKQARAYVNRVQHLLEHRRLFATTNLWDPESRFVAWGFGYSLDSELRNVVTRVELALIEMKRGQECLVVLEGTELPTELTERDRANGWSDEHVARVRAALAFLVGEMRRGEWISDAALRTWQDAIAATGARYGPSPIDLHPTGHPMMAVTRYSSESSARNEVLAGRDHDDLVRAQIASEGPVWRALWMLNWEVALMSEFDARHRDRA